MKVLAQFYSDTLGGSFGKPRLAYNGDGWYVGECVSYVRQYMEQVQGIVTGNWGDAKDFWTNPAVLRLYDRVSSPREGDIVVWGDDAGNWTGPAGHIAIWYNGQILNQNFGGSRKVTTNAMFTPGLLGYLRLKKENEVKPTNDQIEATINYIHLATFGVQVGEEVASSWRGLLKGDYLSGLQTILTANDANRGALKFTASSAGDKALIIALQDQLKAANSKLEDASQATPSEAEKKLQAIKDALSIK